MRLTHTGCYGCKYNNGWQCSKDGTCKGVEHYPTFATSTSGTPTIDTISNTSVMPEELEINGVKYKRE